MKLDFVIKPDKGVVAPASRGRGRPKDAVRKGHVDAFLKMTVDDSFFVEGAKRRDLEFLRKAATALGAKVEMAEVEDDEIFHLPGLRVWRRYGLIDEL